MKNFKGTCKRQHEGEIFRENLRGIPHKIFLIMFSTREEECLDGGFFYAFEKDSYIVMHGVMIHFNGICYAFHDAMMCN